MKSSNASFSICGKYRWNLQRRINESNKEIIYFGLNPSKANYKYNDQTLTRVIKFVDLWGYGSLTVINLFAVIATNPKLIKLSRDPIGEENNKEIIKRMLLWSKNPICDLWLGWGDQGSYKNRNKEVLKLINTTYLKRIKFFPDASPPYIIGLTKKGNPRHPLYVSKNNVLRPT